MDEPRLTHVDGSGEARMVDVGGKEITRRAARAGARVWMAPATLRLLQEQALPKGDVLGGGQGGGHHGGETHVGTGPALSSPVARPRSISPSRWPRTSRGWTSSARRAPKTAPASRWRPSVGAAVAAITIYDMCKAVDRGMIVGDIRLLEKTGGKEDYVRADMAVPAAGAARPASPSRRAAGTVVAVNVSVAKGERKTPMPEVMLRVEHGIEGDAHAGPWHRQVSLLAQESIDKMVAAGLDVGPGDFAENITTIGVDVASLPLFTTLELGEALVEVTQIGKECHTRCAIYHQAGDCVMPREGIFVRVLRGGRVAPGDPVRVRAWGTGPRVGARSPATAAPADGEPALRAGGRRVTGSAASACRPIRAAVVTLSDKASVGLRADASGPTLADLLRGIGRRGGRAGRDPRRSGAIEQTLADLADSGEVDLILTTGGTGLAPRDHTPEATLAVADRLAPGLRGSHAGRLSGRHTARHAQPRRVGGAQEDSHHQHAGQSQGLPGAFRGDRAGARPRGRDAAGGSLRVRYA